MKEPVAPPVKKKRTAPENRNGSMPQRRARTPRRKQIGEGTKITAELVDKVCQAVRIGAPLQTARAYAGIPAAVFYEWMRAGREGYSPYVEFVEALDSAMAEGEMRDIARVDQGADKDWRASAFKLERRFPDRWGEKKEIAATVGFRPMLDPSKLTLEEMLQLKALLAKAAPEAANLPAGAAPAGEILAATLEGEVLAEEDVT